MQLFEETGTVCSIQGYHENTWKKLSSQDELAIIEAVLDNPCLLYLRQVALKFLHASAICKFLHKQQFSRKS